MSDATHAGASYRVLSIIFVLSTINGSGLLSCEIAGQRGAGSSRLSNAHLLTVRIGAPACLYALMTAQLIKSRIQNPDLSWNEQPNHDTGEFFYAVRLLLVH